MLKYRYPGASPFSAEESVIFHGREQDVKKLLRRIHLAKVVVLHSKSGLGKSSLINAGIIPELSGEGSLKPIRIRFGAFSPDNAEAPVVKANQFLDPDAEKDTFLDGLLPEDASLWRYLKKRQLTADAGQGYLLIFDQFEELFTYPADQIRAFSRQLAELQGVTLPQRFLEEAMRRDDLEDAAIGLLHQDLEVRVLLAIRSDRLHLLGDLSTVLPGILSNLYELKPLHRTPAEDAILKPAYEKREDFLAPPFDIEDDAIEKILDYLTQGRQNEVEPFQLQIICQHLERKVVREKLPVISVEDLGDLNHLFENYYQNQIAALGSEEEQHRARLLIEDGLVFEEEERRLSLYEGQIEKTYGVDKALLSKLIDSRLLRAEPSPKGGYTYELSHDTIVRPVLKSRAKRKEEERRLAEEQALREQEAALAEERHKRKRVTRLAILGGALTIIATVGMVISSIFYKRLENTQKDLNAARDSLIIQDSINQALKDSINRSLVEVVDSLRGTKDESKFGIILANDSKRGEWGADYELLLFKNKLKIEDVRLVYYGDRWYTAILCKNADEAYKRISELSKFFDETNASGNYDRTFRTPSVKWFSDLERRKDPYQGDDNENDSGFIFEKNTEKENQPDIE